MTAEPRYPQRPVMIPQICCLVDAGCYVTEIGSKALAELAVLPALAKLYDPAGLAPTADDQAELLTAAGEQALAGGWVQRVDGYWLCPEHAATYLDQEPRHFTLAECVRRHRFRQGG